MTEENIKRDDEEISKSDLDRLNPVLKKTIEIAEFNEKKLIQKYFGAYEGKKILGIFLKYGVDAKTKEGNIKTNILADGLAIKLAKAGFVVIAVGNVYEEKDGQIQKNPIIDELWNELSGIVKKGANYRMTMLLPSVVSHAVFILLNKHSASIHEEIAFHLNNCKDKSSVAIALVDEIPEITCSDLSKEKTELGEEYYICKSNNFRETCKSQEKNCCFTTHLGISATTMEFHIDESYSNVVLVDKYSNLDRVILAMLNR